MIGITVTNGLVVGFEFSIKNKIAQLHLGPISVIFIWALDDDGE